MIALKVLIISDLHYNKRIFHGVDKSRAWGWLLAIIDYHRLFAYLGIFVILVTIHGQPPELLIIIVEIGVLLLILKNFMNCLRGLQSSAFTVTTKIWMY